MGTTVWGWKRNWQQHMFGGNYHYSLVLGWAGQLLDIATEMVEFTRIARCIVLSPRKVWRNEGRRKQNPG